MRCVIAGSRPWCTRISEVVSRQCGVECVNVSRPDELVPEGMAALKPRYIFFPHWSWIIPESIWGKYECVIFHMTDVPYGRGGSPLQNLIARGHTETRLSALRCTGELDAGPVYLKRPLSLFGSAEEIYLRANALMAEMITEIATRRPEPTPQAGEVVPFRRRTPAESDMSSVAGLQGVFDHIRMLDAEGYPLAFLEIGNLRLEFSRASLRSNCVLADVRITEKTRGYPGQGK